MPRKVFITLALAGFALATAVSLFLTHSAAAPAKALTPDLNMDLLSIPDFALVDQDDHPVTRADLHGHISVIDFIFTSCPFICPPMGRNMLQTQSRLAGSGVHYYSFSVDPGHDTPAALRAYADELGADTATWSFLTGDIEQVRTILRDGLKLSDLDRDPDTPITLKDGSTMANIAHPSRFILLGPDAEVLAFYNGLTSDQIDMLVARARAAAASVSSR